MFISELWVNTRLFMSKSELWVKRDRQTDKHAHRHIDTMTRPGLGAGPSEKSSLITLTKIKGIAKPNKLTFHHKTL